MGHNSTPYGCRSSAHPPTNIGVASALTGGDHLGLFRCGHAAIGARTHQRDRATLYAYPILLPLLLDPALSFLPNGASCRPYSHRPPLPSRAGLRAPLASVSLPSRTPPSLPPLYVIVYSRPLCVSTAFVLRLVGAGMSPSAIASLTCAGVPAIPQKTSVLL